MVDRRIEVVERWVGGQAIGTAVDVSIPPIAPGRMWPNSLAINAATPATCGPAIDVPC